MTTSRPGERLTCLGCGADLTNAPHSPKEREACRAKVRMAFDLMGVGR